MAENQNEQNPFLAAMEEEKQKSTPETKVVEEISKFAVNPVAEGTVNCVAGFMLAIGIIGCFILLILGFYQFDDGVDSLGWTFIGISIAVLLIGIVEWAFLKVFVNISRNLYNINAAIHELKK